VSENVGVRALLLSERLISSDIVCERLSVPEDESEVVTSADTVSLADMDSSCVSLCVLGPVRVTVSERVVDTLSLPVTKVVTVIEDECEDVADGVHEAEGRIDGEAEPDELSEAECEEVAVTELDNGSDIEKESELVDVSSCERVSLRVAE
jgi:hypothetical protein